MEEAEVGGGSADTRKGRPAAAGERDRARGGRRRRHGAHTLAHTRSHSTPGRSPPEGPLGGRGERCNLLATDGNCKGARGPRPLVQACGAPPARPRRRLQNPAAPSHRLGPGERAFAFPTRGKRKSAAAAGCRPGLGGKASFFSFSSPRLLPAPAQLGGLEPLSGTRPVGPPPEPPRVTGSRPSRRGGPRRRSAELREVCHTSRGATGWHGNGAAAPLPLSGPDGRHALWGGLGRRGQRRGVSAYVL